MADTEAASTVIVQPSTNGDSQNEQMEFKDPFMTNEARRVLEIIFFGVFSCIVSFLGIGANVINIVIFFKQGFNDSVNISFCGLAVADLCSLFPLLWMSFCYNPLILFSNKGFISGHIQYLTAAWPHMCFVWIINWITVFIAFERCVCIALPLKVKTIFTPKRILITLIIIFVVMTGCCLPLFFSIFIITTFDNNFNKSLQGLSPFKYNLILPQFSYTVHTTEQISSVFILIILTIILIVYLRAKSHWRRGATMASLSSKTHSISQRDRKAIVMITTLSFVFIVCYLPTTINCIMVITLSPDYGITGRYSNIFFASWAVVTPFESINSTISIIIYYNMSTKFKISFTEIMTLSSRQ